MLGEHVGFHVDRVALFSGGQLRALQRFRNDRDVEDIAARIDNREAYAVDGDRPLRNQILRYLGRGTEGPQCEVTLRADGLNAADAPAEQITEALTGRQSERTEWSVIGGAAMLVAGAVMAGAALVRGRG